MKGLCLIFIIIAALPVFAVPSASADAPQPWMYGAVKCSGLGVLDVQRGFAKLGDWYGGAHQLSNEPQWVNAYPSIVNEWAYRHGCPTAFDDEGRLTLYYKTYDSVYIVDLVGAQPY